MTTLREDIRTALNRASAENASDTPDAILAGYLMASLEAFDAATRARDSWHGFKPSDVVDRPAAPGTPAPAYVHYVVTRCPECAQGKHVNCTLTVFDAEETTRTCPCEAAGHEWVFVSDTIPVAVAG